VSTRDYADEKWADPTEAPDGDKSPLNTRKGKGPWKPLPEKVWEKERKGERPKSGGSFFPSGKREEAAPSPEGGR